MRRWYKFIELQIKGEREGEGERDGRKRMRERERRSKKGEKDWGREEA